MGPNRNKRPCLQQPYLDFKQSQGGHVYHTHCLNTSFVLHHCAVKPTWFTKATIGLVTYKRGKRRRSIFKEELFRCSISAKNAPLLQQIPTYNLHGEKTTWPLPIPSSRPMMRPRHPDRSKAVNIWHHELASSLNTESAERTATLEFP